MKQPFFSIITSVNLCDQERVDKFLRCIESVKKQTFRNFEWVIVDDGSPMPFLWKDTLSGIPKIKVIHKEHAERVIGYNTGFQKAKGEWFTLLDSDDAYDPSYLSTLYQHIVENPMYKLFNFGSVHIDSEGDRRNRDAFKPKVEEVGHEVFGGGNIVWGTFAFHRSVYEDLGAYPPAVIENIDCSEINYGGVRNLYMNTPYDFSAAAQIEFPELRQYFMVDHEAEPEKIIKELGNPWGNDHYLFLKYTRKYHSKPFDKYLYIVH